MEGKRYSTFELTRATRRSPEFLLILYTLLRSEKCNDVDKRIWTQEEFDELKRIKHVRYKATFLDLLARLFDALCFRFVGECL